MLEYGLMWEQVHNKIEINTTFALERGLAEAPTHWLTLWLKGQANLSNYEAQIFLSYLFCSLNS